MPTPDEEPAEDGCQQFIRRNIRVLDERETRRKPTNRQGTLEGKLRPDLPVTKPSLAKLGPLFCVKCWQMKVRRRKVARGPWGVRMPSGMKRLVLRRRHKRRELLRGIH